MAAEGKEILDKVADFLFIVREQGKEQYKITVEQTNIYPEKKPDLSWREQEEQQAEAEALAKKVVLDCYEGQKVECLPVGHNCFYVLVGG